MDKRYASYVSGFVEPTNLSGGHSWLSQIPQRPPKLGIADFYRKVIRHVAGCWFVGGDDLTGDLHVLQLQLTSPLLRFYCSTVSNFYCYFVHMYVFTVDYMICVICSSVISFFLLFLISLYYKVYIIIFFYFVCVILQFQLCCCTAQLHCNTSVIVIGD